ncbi:hypothetical protein C9374_003210 [Naegleria lovaniensis]|uniref:Cytochrome P450 n=1 Tax=Naegleria lovaniensis TaxID=51637 RepID=A0AA88GUJ1_NAELO|nr:uncharacterized protein C9374_003210 [Naegleria lovaniensis]KAG2386061.1 hypothetical protein C9374_003210 [Naegleria lovaniensis]
MSIWEILFVAFVLLLAYAIFMALSTFNNWRKVRHIPGSWQPLHLFNKTPFLSPYLYWGCHEAIEQLRKTIGDPKTHTLRMSLWSHNSVSICDKDLLKEVMVMKSHDFIKQKKIYALFNTFGENILSALEIQGDNWKRHHRVASGAFSSKNLEYMSQVAVNSVDLIRSAKWDKDMEQALKSGKKGILLDANADFSDVTLDVLGKAGFGLDFSIFDEVNPDGKVFRRSLEFMLSTGVMWGFLFTNLYPALSFLLPYVNKWTGVEKSVQVVSSTLDRIISERRKELESNASSEFSADSTEERRDLLSVMVSANMEQKGILTDEELKSDAYVFSLAGHETTATAMQWVCYELGKRPEIQCKAREEVDRVLGKGTNARKPYYDDYTRLHYVNAVIMEALRLHPPVLGVFRAARKNTTIGPYSIPKDTTVAIDIYSANRSEKNWEKPLEFLPERFPLNADAQLKIQHDFTFIPFSMGNRKCIGYKFALIEACMILSRLLQFYELELLNDESNPKDRVHDIPGVTVRPGNLKVLLKPRSDL